MQYHDLPTVFTADEFSKIIAGDAKDPFVAYYLQQDLDRMSGNRQGEIRGDIANGKKQHRYVRPFFYTTMSVKMGSNPLRENEYPTYLIQGDVTIDGATTDWGIGLFGCVFTGSVKIANLKGLNYLQISKCTFRGGLLLENVATTGHISIDGVADMSNVQILNCQATMLNVSDVILAPKIVAFKGSYNMSPSVRK